MPSPFPGMDPYLEQDKVWTAFHEFFIKTLFQVVAPGLVEKYRIRVQERVYTIDQVLFTSVNHEEHREPYLEIRSRADGKLITQVEAISPANKTTPVGRQVYLAKRQEAQRTKANLVEIDLGLEGQRMHDFSQENLPSWDYSVVVTRSPRPDQFELYTANLDKRLPRFRLPLTGDDRDAVVDLQAVINRVFDLGDFAQRVDYQRDPAIRLDAEQKTWLDRHLREQNARV